MKQDDELYEAFEEVNSFIKNKQFAEAAEIIAYYVKFLSNHSGRFERDLKADYTLFLKELPDGFVKFTTFTHFIKELIRFADNGEYMDPRTIQN